MAAEVSGRSVKCHVGSENRRLMSHRVVLVSLLSSLVSLAAPGAAAQSADLILQHAIVYTGDAAHRSAQAVAVRNGNIVYVGTDAGSAKFAGPATRMIDLQGRFVFPGFVDAHGHFRSEEHTSELQSP